MRTCTYNTHFEAVMGLKADLAGRTVDLGRRHLVITPDIYTFTLEKELFLSGGAGAMDVEVTTFNRLYMRRALDPNEVLTRKGARMLIKRLALARARELNCFTRSIDKQGFADKLYDTFSMLITSGVSPDELHAAGLKHTKLHDIRLLYADYLAAIAGKYTDTAGRLHALTRRIRANAAQWKHTDVSLVLFERSSAAMRGLVEALDEASNGVTVYEAAEQTTYRTGDRAELQSVPDTVTQLKEAAKRIRHKAYGGVRYDQMCVVDECADFEEAARIFTEFDIPFYMAKPLKLSETEPVRFLTAAFRFVWEGCRRADAVLLVKNRLSAIPRADADAFENYVLSRRVDHTLFLSPFTAGEHAPCSGVDTAAHAESARRAMLAAVSPLFSLQKTADAKRLAAAVRRILDKTDAAGICAGLSETGVDLSQVPEKIEHTLYAFEALMTGELPLSVLAQTLLEGFAGERISNVPLKSDCVTVGALDTFRGQRFAYAVILNFNEGVLPVTDADEGLLTDADLQSLGETAVEPTAEDKNRTARKVLKDFLCTQNDLYISFVLSDGARPSYVRKLLEPRTLIDREYFGRTYDVLFHGTPAALAVELSAPLHALETLLRRPDMPFAPEVIAALQRRFDIQAMLHPKPARPALTDPQALFFPRRRTSVSALQTYFDCPYKFYLQYGLRLKARDTGETRALDLGLVLHAVAERFINAGDFTSDTAARLAEEEIAKNELLNRTLDGRVRTALVAEAQVLCGILVSQLNAGAFTPFASEADYGEGKLLPALKIGNAQIAVEGTIDRVDVWGEYARIIDYKTGSTEFDYADVYYGKRLQLAVYMRVIEEKGFQPAGCFYLPFAVSWRDDEFAHRLDGPYDGSPALLVAADKRLEQGARSEVIACSTAVKKDGTLRMYPNSRALTGTQLRALSGYALHAASRAADDIASGQIPAYPWQKKERTPCGYCDYRTVCGHDGAVRRLAGAGKADILAAEGVSNE